VRSATPSSRLPLLPLFYRPDNRNQIDSSHCDRFLRQICTCESMHPYMKGKETPEQVRIWFQTEVRKLWPVAFGSLSLRKSPCIREHCQLCESGQGHSSFALYGRKGSRRFAVYVPERLVKDVKKAIRNGRTFQQLLSEAGRRYTLARKNEHSSRPPR
jgi:hypothetical protein